MYPQDAALGVLVDGVAVSVAGEFDGRRVVGPGKQSRQLAAESLVRHDDVDGERGVVPRVDSFATQGRRHRCGGTVSVGDLPTEFLRQVLEPDHGKGRAVACTSGQRLG